MSRPSILLLFFFPFAAIAVCTIGQTWDGYLCAPAFHAPLALEPSLMNTEVDLCHNFQERICGRWMSQQQTSRIEQIKDYVYNNARNKISQNMPPPMRALYDSCNINHPGETAVEYAHLVGTILDDVYYDADVPVMWARLARLMLPAPFVFGILDNNTYYFNSSDTGLPSNLTQLMVQHTYTATKLLHQHNVLELQHGIQAVMKIHLAMRQRAGGSIYAPMKLRDLQWTHWESYMQTLNGIPYRPSATVIVESPMFLQWLFRDSNFAVHEWKAFARFAILYTLNHMKTDNCIDLAINSLPNLAANAFLDTYPYSYERLNQLFLDITGKEVELGVRQKAEPFAGRLSPDRYEHNLFMIRRYLVAHNLPINNTLPFVELLALQPPLFNPEYDNVSLYAIFGPLIADVATVYHSLFDSRPEMTLGNRQHFFMVAAQAYCSEEMTRAIVAMPAFKHDFSCQ